MKYLILLFAILFFKHANSQYVLKIVLKQAATKNAEDVFVAGSFNEWNPHNNQYKLKLYGVSRRALVIENLSAGNYEFKFTRGSFDKVETTAKGEDISNHNIQLDHDTTIEYVVAGWKDDFPNKPRRNTASAQVHIIDTAFFIPQLNRTRRIWAYLPAGYATSNKRYPVIYMHDGQNLFNEQTAPYGEWGVDEALDSITKRHDKEAIIIGIDHGGDKRMNEYNPYDHVKFGKGEGKSYAAFLVNTLKPFIDKKYRTIPDARHTFVAGSSMGGLISMYAVAAYPKVFGGAGVFSPAFWTAPAIYDSVKVADLGGFKKFYFYAGGEESDAMVPDMDKMISVVEQKGNYETRRVVDPLAKHNEAAWRKVFGDFYLFITK